jgi:hypothetical protein
MLDKLFKKKTDDEIQKELAKKRDELIVRASKMNKLINSKDSGWFEFVALLDDYISACQRRKAVTALDTADERTLQQLKYLDHEVFILTWAKSIPQQVMRQLEELENKDKPKE